MKPIVATIIENPNPIPPRRIVTREPAEGTRRIRCANLATAQLYAGDSTRIGREAFANAWETEGTAPFYVVEVGASEAVEETPSESPDFDAVLLGVKTKLGMVN